MSASSSYFTPQRIKQIGEALARTETKKSLTCISIPEDSISPKIGHMLTVEMLRRGLCIEIKAGILTMGGVAN